MPKQVKCSHCGLVQFDPPGSPCRRCRKPLGNEVSESIRPRSRSSNPYQAPATNPAVVGAPGSVDREQLKGIAEGQRWVIYSILAQFGMIALLVVGRAVLPDAVAAIILVIGLLITAVMSIYGTYTLAARLYNPVAAILLLFLSLFLGFLLLLFLSAAANSRFNKAGLRVGLLGVPASAFD